MDSVTEQSLVETDSFCISFLGGRKKRLLKNLSMLRPQSEYNSLQKVVTKEFRGALYKCREISFFPQPKKRTFMWFKTHSGMSSIGPDHLIMSQQKFQFPSWLYAAGVSSKDESACPVRYHQHPRAPADLFAEFIEATRALNMLLMNQKYGAQVW